MKKIILSLLFYSLFIVGIIRNASAVSCSMDFWRNDYNLHNSVYSSIGAWYNGAYFIASLSCNPPNLPAPNNYCIGWRQTVNNCARPDGSVYENGGNIAWSPLPNVPSSGSSWCITAWVREKGTRPDGSFGCLDSTSIYPSTGTLPLWPPNHQINTLNYLVTTDPVNSNIYIDYYVKLSGNAFPGEYAELREGFSSGFCGPQILGVNKDFTCRKIFPPGTNIDPYVSTNLCGIVADTRYSQNCLVPVPAPIRCSTSFNPVSGTITAGSTFDARGKVNSISGGNGTGYDFMWIRKYGPGNFVFPPTVNPVNVSIWYPVRWNSAGLSVGDYYLVIQAKNKDKSWNDSVSCDGQITVTVIRPPAEPWFQTKGGDVSAATDIISLIPTIVGDKSFSVGLNGFPGLIVYSGNNVNFIPGGTVSSTNWLANDSVGISGVYNSLYKKLGSPTEINYPCKLGSFPCPDPPTPSSGQTTVYYTDQKLTINNNWNIPLGAKVIVLVNNDLEINKEIHVPDGSFLMFAVKGTIGGGISVKGTVGNKLPLSSPHLEGVYVTDGTINTNYDSDTSGKRLVMAGSFIAQQGFLLGRDLKNGVIPPATINNDLYPAELFIARPDLMVNSPHNIFNTSIDWKEVVP